MRTLLCDIDALYTCDRQDRQLGDAHVVVEGQRIVQVGSGPVEGHFDQRISLSGCVVLPGLINLHHHFFQTLTRGIPLALSGHLLDWLRAMYPLWAGITPDDLRAAAEATAAELLLTGATTSVDHAYLMPGCDPAFTDGLVAGAQTAGLRLHLVSGSMTALEDTLEAELSIQLGPRAGGLVASAPEVQQDMRRAIARHHQPGWGSRNMVALGTTTFGLRQLDHMRQVAALADEAGCGLHLHFHPRPDERAWCMQQHQLSPLALLQQVGWVRPGTWFAHGTRLDADDMQCMAAHRVAVAHCPRMIPRLGARVTPVHQMLAAGVTVGFGVDGGASNDSGSMLGDLRLGLLLHRLAGGEGQVPWQQWLTPYRALTMATRDAASILGRDDIGRIEPGCCADIVAFDLRSIHFAGARTEALSGLLLAGGDTRTAMTMVGGGIRALQGRLLWADERVLRGRVDAATARLVAQAEKLTGLDYCRNA